VIIAVSVEIVEQNIFLHHFVNRIF